MAVAPHYYAMSPTEGVTSAHKVSFGKYDELVEAEPITNLNDLFSGVPTTEIDPCPRDWVERLEKALVDSDSESEMNASIQCLLNETFPDKKHYDATRDSVAEQKLSTMFGLGQENGLPISVESKPDFCLSKDGRFLLGEGKNHAHNSIEPASRQNVMYLLVNLYNQVVSRSKLPPAVYGIAVAGSQCSGKGIKYTVKLQQLSLPVFLGGEFQLREFEIVKNEKTDGNLADVWEFISRAFQGEEDANITFGRGCPALLQVPYRTLRDGWNPDVEMVRNGTACLVLKVRTYSGLVSLMELMDDGIRDYVPAIWNKEALAFPLYFKSKNFLVSDKPKERDYLDCIKGRESLDLTEAYKVDPVGRSNCIYILVADLGTMVCDQTCQARNLKFSELAKDYLFFMKRIIRFQVKSRLYHGDIHVRNVTYWQGRFMLIDYDEAHHKKVVKRKGRNDAQKRLYPAALVDEPDSYTKHQLMMTLEDMLSWHKQEYRTEAYCRVRVFFQGYPDIGKEEPEVVERMYETLVELLEECVSFGGDDSAIGERGEVDRKRRSDARTPELRDRHKKTRIVESASPPAVVTAAQVTPAVELKPASVDEMVTGAAVEAVVAEAAVEAVVTEADVASEMKTDEAC